MAASSASYYTSTRFRPDCPSCGNPIGQYEESYKRLLEQVQDPAAVLDLLGIKRRCCRARSLWQVVLPIGGFYLPHHEASMLNYLGLKEEAPQPNLVVLSLQRAVNGQDFIISHADANGFIGRRTTASAKIHEPTEIIISNPGDLTRECQVRVQTEPGEITRGFPFETRAFRRDLQIDKVRSYFDLAPAEDSVPVTSSRPAVTDETQEQVLTDDEDEPLYAADEKNGQDSEEADDDE